jgi:hypothetical protein
LARLIGPSVKASKQEYTSQSKSLSVSSLNLTPSGDHTNDKPRDLAEKCSHVTLAYSYQMMSISKRKEKKLSDDVPTTSGQVSDYAQLPSKGTYFQTQMLINSSIG